MMDLEQKSKEELIQIIGHLTFELDQLKRAVFGSKSERFVPSSASGQGNLFSKSSEETTEVPEPQEQVVRKVKKSRNKPVRQKIPAHLPRIETVIEPDLDVSQMKPLGVEVSEKLELEPARFYVRKTVRPKYIDEDSQIHIAPLKDPFPKCMAGSSVVAHVAVQKYVDHLPLYRQSKIFKREQIDLPRSTLSGMIKRTARLLEPLYEVLNKQVMASDYVQADESSLPVLTTDKPGSAMKGCMLAKVSPEEKLVSFDYIKTKEKPNILQSLQDFKGYLQVDGNVSYQPKGEEEEVELMHCLVHSRRKFEQALVYDEKRSGYVLEQIKKLYLLERDGREANLTTQQIQEKRQKEAIPILQDLKEWLENNYDDEEPSNPFKRAVRYMLIRWNGLIKYTTKGHLRPDNNLIENQIRPLALGRKNYLFAGSHQGAEYAAIFYSLFATCRLHDLDPKAWLQDVLNRIGDHHVNKLVELLPTEQYQFTSQESTIETCA